MYVFDCIFLGVCLCACLFLHICMLLVCVLEWWFLLYCSLIISCFTAFCSDVGFFILATLCDLECRMHGVLLLLLLLFFNRKVFTAANEFLAVFETHFIFTRMEESYMVYAKFCMYTSSGWKLLTPVLIVSVVFVVLVDNYNDDKYCYYSIVIIIRIMVICFFHTFYVFFSQLHWRNKQPRVNKTGLRVQIQPLSLQWRMTKTWRRACAKCCNPTRTAWRCMSLLKCTRCVRQLLCV